MLQRWWKSLGDGAGQSHHRGPTGVEVGAKSRAVAAEAGPSKLRVDERGYSEGEVGVSEQ